MCAPQGSATLYDSRNGPLPNAIAGRPGNSSAFVGDGLNGSHINPGFCPLVCRWRRSRSLDRLDQFAPDQSLVPNLLRQLLRLAAKHVFAAGVLRERVALGCAGNAALNRKLMRLRNSRLASPGTASKRDHGEKRQFNHIFFSHTPHSETHTSAHTVRLGAFGLGASQPLLWMPTCCAPLTARFSNAGVIRPDGRMLGHRVGRLPGQVIPDKAQILARLPDRALERGAAS